MADNVTVDNNTLTDFVVSTDEAASGHVQRFKLAYSGDGLDTHVTADASGLLVNLGTNNDVTVTSGTITVGGTPAVTLASGTAVFSGSLTAGTAYIGVTDIGSAGTTTVDVLQLTSGTALAVGLYDTDGVQLGFAAPVILAGTATNGTAVYASGDTMGTAITFSNATLEAGKTGHIISAICYVTSDVSQDLRLWLFDSTVTPSADNAAFSLSAADIVKTQGVISFTNWYDGGTVHIGIGSLTPDGNPLHYNTTGTTNLIGVAESRGTGTYATATVAFELHSMLD